MPCVLVHLVTCIQRADGKIEGIGEPHILSDFADAAKSYEMTWYIRNSAEASSKKVREANGIELPEAPVAAEGADGWRKADL